MANFKITLTEEEAEAILTARSYLIALWTSGGDPNSVPVINQLTNIENKLKSAGEASRPTPKKKRK